MEVAREKAEKAKDVWEKVSVESENTQKIKSDDKTDKKALDKKVPPATEEKKSKPVEVKPKDELGKKVPHEPTKAQMYNVERIKNEIAGKFEARHTYENESLRKAIREIGFTTPKEDIMITEVKLDGNNKLVGLKTNNGIDVTLENGNIIEVRSGEKKAKIISNPKYFSDIAHKIESSNPKGAIEVYKRTLEIDPNNADAHARIGKIFVELKDYGKASEFYKRALEINPSKIYWQCEAGRIFQEVGNIPEAINAYKKSIKLSPEYELPYKNLGKIYREAGRNSDALNVYRKLKEITTNPIYKKKIEQIITELDKRDHIVIERENAEKKEALYEKHKKDIPKKEIEVPEDEILKKAMIDKGMAMRKKEAPRWDPKYNKLDITDPKTGNRFQILDGSAGQKSLKVTFSKPIKYTDSYFEDAERSVNRVITDKITDLFSKNQEKIYIDGVYWLDRGDTHTPKAPGGTISYCTISLNDIRINGKFLIPKKKK